MPGRNQLPPSLLLALFAILLALMSGCRTTPSPPKTYTFFPPAPDEPRVQFLTGFSSDIDLGQSSSFSSFITGRPSRPNPLVKPYGLALNQGKLYVCDTMTGAVEVFDLAKKRGHYFAPKGEGRLQTPINITIDADGTRYLADTGCGRVLLYGPDEAYLGTIAPKEGMKPTDVASTHDRLYITDLKGHCVRVYRKSDRQPLFTIPREEKDPKGKLYLPTNLAVDQQGHVLVSDLGGFAVEVFDAEGNYLRTIGQLGVAPGLFARPKGVAVDREGRVYVVDAATQVVQVFDGEGKLLMFFGQPGASLAGELNLPAAVKVDYDHVSFFQHLAAPGFKLEYLILVTNQFGDPKVNVYGFLTKQ